MSPARRSGNLPGCDTGPGGRLAFVVGEIRAALRRRRAAARRTFFAPERNEQEVQR